MTSEDTVKFEFCGPDYKGDERCEPMGGKPSYTVQELMAKRKQKYELAWTIQGIQTGMVIGLVAAGWRQGIAKDPGLAPLIQKMISSGLVESVSEAESFIGGAINGPVALIGAAATTLTTGLSPIKALREGRTLSLERIQQNDACIYLSFIDTANIQDMDDYYVRFSSVLAEIK